MATIRQKGPDQWHAQVRRTGWPPVTETLRTRKDAAAWARDVKSQMDRGIFVDRSAAERTTFGETIKTYIKEVTDQRRARLPVLPRNRGLNGSCRTSRSCVHMRSPICGLSTSRNIAIVGSLKS